MNFRTEINIEKFPHQISHSDNILTIGSCFAENIAEYFKFSRFNVMANPFGVLYNPISIYNSLKFVVNNHKFIESDLVFHQSEWHSFYHHSDFSHHKKEIILENINSGIEKTLKFLQKTDVIIITFGTSFVYKHLENGIIVSNCHKIPQKEFAHFMLNLDETVTNIKNIVELVELFNPKIRFILTVSPVRHWKNGAHSNQLSKANLLLAINEVINSKNNCSYFPSYEIIMDDLRDYRFYNTDLIHPNKIATDYIWEKFSNSNFSNECLKSVNEVSKIVLAKNHRVRNLSSDEHQNFLRLMISKINLLQQKHPFLNLNDDLRYFKSQIL